MVLYFDLRMLALYTKKKAKTSKNRHNRNIIIILI